MSEITNFKGNVQTAQQYSSVEIAVDELLSRVGERVRKVREQRGIPRRVLSEKSGVSPRYLAQLESGAGNISIGLLKRVAHALDIRIEWLVSEEDPWTSDALRVAEMFRKSNGDVRDSVLKLLQPETPKTMRSKRICLLGLRGAGKSTLGNLAGSSLGVPFLELNREIEDHSGMPVSELMALYGQEGYRMLEAQALNRVISTHDSVILAVAGGIVSNPETYNNLLSNFHTVWVRATPSEHMERVWAQGDIRPMTGNPEAMDQLKSLLTAREAMYERALEVLNTSGETVDESLNKLLELIDESVFFVADRQI